jgi:cytochrome c oxidase subunit 2
MWNFPLFPPEATGHAAEVDTLFIVLTVLALVFTLGVAFSILYFVVRYRKGAAADRRAPPVTHIRLELAWIFIPFGLGLLIYAWAGLLYLKQQSVPKNALTIYVMGQQWMWKFQHPAGKREIDELHIPIGRPVRLVMTSQDVIHSLFVPAFRVKQDVLPGHYTQLWFQATKTGKFHLFCAEYCGTQHSGMTGWVTVMEQAAYEQWLSQVTTATSASATGTPPAARGPSMASQGEQLFR